MKSQLERSRRHLALLAALVALLTLAALWLDREQQPTLPTPLTQLDPLTLSHAEIKGPAGPIQLERRADGWWLTAPIQAPADELRSQALLALLTTPSRQRLAYDPARASAFGLDTPALQITLDGQLQLDFGSEAPLNGGRYLRSGDTIHLINSRFFYYLSGPAEGFVARATDDMAKP